MKRIVFLLLSFLVFIQSEAQYSQDSAWIRDNYIKTEMYIPMRDGTRLFTSIYAPKDQKDKYPILMKRTPYSVAPYGENLYAKFERNFFKYYLREGYIIVQQDVRGRYMSEGEFMDVRPFNPNKKNNTDVDEASDTYDTIEWLLKNISNNNGRVGVSGISYPGFYSTMAALSGHPALKAVSPQAPVTDWFIGDDFHHNGAFFQMDGFAFYSSFGKPRPKPTSSFNTGFTFPVADNYKFYLDAATLPELARLMGDSIKFWKDLYAHPTYDTFWQARNPRNFTGHIAPTTTTLVVGGLFDAEDVFGAWRTYEAIEKKAKNNNMIVMGPWYHGQWASGDGTHLGNVRFGSNTSEWYQNNIELPFFNHLLKDKGEKLNLAEATIFFTGENAWKTFDKWPPAAATPTPVYLQAGGSLAWTKPSTSNSFSEYVSDPSKPVPYTEDVHQGRTREYMIDDQRFASRRPDVLVFETDVLENDLTVAGTVTADILTTITTTDADFVVKIIDVFPEGLGTDNANGQNYLMSGYQMLVRGEVMRGKFRKSFENPVPFKPGKVEQVRFDLPDIAHTFKKGHKLMIQIQSSWFPLVDRNPQKFMNIYTAEKKDFQKAGIRIHHDNRNASSIILPVLK